MENLLPEFFEKVGKESLEKLSACSEIVVAGQFSKTRTFEPESLRLVVLTGRFLVYYEVSFRLIQDGTKTRIKRLTELTF